MKPFWCATCLKLASWHMVDTKCRKDGHVYFDYPDRTKKILEALKVLHKETK